MMDNHPNHISLKFSVPLEYTFPLMIKNSNSSLSLIIYKNNTQKLVITLPNSFEKEVKVNKREILVVMISIINDLLHKIFMFGSQLKNNTVENYFKKYITNQELVSKKPFKNNLSISESLMTFYTLQQFNFHKVIISRKIFFLVFSDKTIFIFNLNNKLVYSFSIAKTNVHSQEGKTRILWKINESNQKMQLTMRFFSKNEKNYFLDELGLKTLNKKGCSTHFHYVKLLTELAMNDSDILRYLLELNRKRVRKNGKVYYIKQIFQMSNSDFLNCRNGKNFYKTYKHLNFLFSSKVIEKITKHRPSLLFDRIGDLEEHECKNNSLDKNLLIVLENQFTGKVIKKSSMRNQQNMRLDRTNTFVHHKGAPMMNDSFLKTNSFTKLNFEILYKDKQKMCMEITCDGILKIYKQGKMDNLISFTFEDIELLEGTASTPTITLTTTQKKLYTLDFANLFEKYIFRSAVYNYLVCNMQREKLKNQMRLNVNVMTWNVAVIDVPNDLIKMMVTSKILENSDIFTFGVQECGIFKIKAWQKTVKTIAASYNFCEVKSIEMCQMFLMVFIKQDLLPFVENIEASYKPMGFAKIIGNKGGLVISFKLMGYNFVFVNCHLAPKPHKVLERNNHAKNLIKSIRVGDKFCEFDTMADYLFWQGDLNYRVDYIYDEVLNELKKQNIRMLLTKDQLIKQRTTNQLFYNFQEADICFFPTYRRVKGTEQYSNKNNQAPSWCDRILVKTNRNLDLLFYDSIKELKMSDHLPVVGKYSIYLTTPTFDDVEKDLNDNKNSSNYIGRFIFDKINLEFNFTEAFAEIDLAPKFPFKVKLSLHYFMNSKCAESKLIEIKDEEVLDKICFEDIRLNYPSQLFFNFPHSRAINIFFVLTAIVNKTNYEIGFAKYSLEDIENNGLNLISHSIKIDITLRTRKFGTFLVNAKYKF